MARKMKGGWSDRGEGGGWRGSEDGRAGSREAGQEGGRVAEKQSEKSSNGETVYREGGGGKSL